MEHQVLLTMVKRFHSKMEIIQLALDQFLVTKIVVFLVTIKMHLIVLSGMQVTLSSLMAHQLLLVLIKCGLVLQDLRNFKSLQMELQVATMISALMLQWIMANLLPVQ